MSTTVFASDMALFVPKTRRFSTLSFRTTMPSTPYSHLTIRVSILVGIPFRRATVFGSVQALRRQVSGLVKSVRVLDAHQPEGGFDKVALVRGTADIIDAGGADAVSFAWVHKLFFVRERSGDLRISRELCMQRV